MYELPHEMPTELRFKIGRKLENFKTGNLKNYIQLKSSERVSMTTSWSLFFH